LREAILASPLLEGEGHHVARISEAHPGSHARRPPSTPRKAPPDAACGLIRATRLREAILASPPLEGEGHHVARISEAHPGSHARGPSSTPRDAPRMRPAALSGLRDCAKQSSQPLSWRARGIT